MNIYVEVKKSVLAPPISSKFPQRKRQKKKVEGTGKQKKKTRLPFSSLIRSFQFIQMFQPRQYDLLTRLLNLAR